MFTLPLLKEKEVILFSLEKDETLHSKKRNQMMVKILKIFVHLFTL